MSQEIMSLMTRDNTTDNDVMFLTGMGDEAVHTYIDEKVKCLII